MRTHLVRVCRFVVLAIDDVCDVVLAQRVLGLGGHTVPNIDFGPCRWVLARPIPALVLCVPCYSFTEELGLLRVLYGI